MQTFKFILPAVFFTVILNSDLYSQITQQWVRQYLPSSNNNQTANDSYIDSAGNVYVTGYNAAGYSHNDIITLKYNSAGEYQWAKSVNNNSNSYSQDAGKCISGYRMNGRQYIYTGAEVNYLGYTYFIWLLKYDEYGNELFRRGYTTAPFGFSNALYNMNSDSAGNVFITGSNGSQIFLAKYDSTLSNIFSAVFSNPGGYHTGIAYDFKINSAGEIFVIGDLMETAANARKMVLLKYSSSGSLLFSKILGNISNSQPQKSKISIGASGNVYVSAQVSGNYYMVKFNNSGDTLWKRVYNGASNSTDYCNASVIDADENFYVTGIVNGIYGDIGTVKYDSTGNLQWVKTMAGSGGWADEGRDIMLDASGNIVVTGSLDISPGGKVVTLKYNPAGTLLWQTSYDFAVSDYEECVVINKDRDDNIIVVGNCGYITVSDFATIKYNSSGSILWNRKFNAAQISTASVNSIATDKNENVYAVGRFRNGQWGDDILLVKYNSAGAKKWEWLRGGIGEDIEDAGNAVCTDNNGNVYITGTIFSTISSNKREVFTMKFDSTGTAKWNIFTSYYGGSKNEEGVEIGTDSAGNVYVGYNAEAAVHTSFGVLKYSPTGTLLWSYGFNGPANDSDKITDMRVDKAGQVYITGNSKTVSNGYDIVTIKLNPSGIPVWLNSYNGSGNSNDESRSVDFDEDGNTYVTGTVINTSTGNDLFVIKYLSNGIQSWTYTKSQGNSNKETGACIKYDSLSGNIRLFGDLKPGFPYDSLGICIVSLDSSGTEIGIIISNPNAYNNFTINGALNASGNIIANTLRKSTNAGYDSRIYRHWINFSDFNGSSSGNDIPAFNESVATNLNYCYSAVTSYDSAFGNVMTIIKYKTPDYLVNLDMRIQGFVYDDSYNHFMYGDTVKVTLRSTVSPYSIIDSAKRLCTFEGNVENLYFEKLTGSNQYYLVVNHRNSIETWSKTPVTIAPGTATVDFKNVENVLGGNLALLPGPAAYGIYSGDVNQDGTIDAADVSGVENDASYSVSGYVPTDVTGDDFVDAGDLSIVENNASLGVNAVIP